MRSPNACLICFCASLSTSAVAQTTPPPRPSSAPSTNGNAGTAAGSPAPRDSAGGAAPGSPAPGSPALGSTAPGSTAPGSTAPGSPAPSGGANAAGNGMPDISDPMLIPVEMPGQVLSNWQQALQLVRTRSTSVAAAHARLSQAQAIARQALAPLLPSLNGNGQVRRALIFGTTTLGARTPDPATVLSAGVALHQSIVDLRSWHDVETAKSDVQAAQLNEEDTERIALGALADTIVTVITAERLADVIRVALRSNLSTWDLTKKRTLLGAASAVDVLRAEQQVAATRLQVLQADNAVRDSREALGMALGFAEAWGVAANIKVDQLASDARAVCSPIEDPEQRSDVRAKRMTLLASERRVKSAGLGLAPTLSLDSAFSYVSLPLNARPLDWSISANLTVPIYDGGLLGAERDNNRALAEVSRQDLTQTARQARLEALQAQRAIQYAQSNFDVSRQARDIAAESARLSRIAFVHGTGTSFDLVDSARQQRETEIDATIKEFEVIRAQITALLALANCNL
jgi:multidrug efflux system outer membrane protein